MSAADFPGIFRVLKIKHPRMFADDRANLAALIFRDGLYTKDAFGRIVLDAKAVTPLAKAHATDDDDLSRMSDSQKVARASEMAERGAAAMATYDRLEHVESPRAPVAAPTTLAAASETPLTVSAGATPKQVVASQMEAFRASIAKTEGKIK